MLNAVPKISGMTGKEYSGKGHSEGIERESWQIQLKRIQQPRLSVIRSGKELGYK